MVQVGGRPTVAESRLQGGGGVVLRESPRAPDRSDATRERASPDLPATAGQTPTKFGSGLRVAVFGIYGFSRAPGTDCDANAPGQAGGNVVVELLVVHETALPDFSTPERDTPAAFAVEKAAIEDEEKFVPFVLHGCPVDHEQVSDRKARSELFLDFAKTGRSW